MKFIEKNIQLLAAIPFALLLIAAAALYFELPGLLLAKAEGKAGQTYSCPKHPDVAWARPGYCPTCRTAMVSTAEVRASHAQCAHGEGKGGHAKCSHETTGNGGCCSKSKPAGTAAVAGGSCTRDLEASEGGQD